MKFTILIAGLLLVINAVNAVPMDMDEEMMEDTLDGDIFLDDAIEDNSTAIIDDEYGEEPTDQYLAELNQYIKEQKSQKSHTRVTRQGSAVLYHGNTIGLQSHVLYRWIGCPASYCDGRDCPRMFMTGSDWTRCWGEAFEIYRQPGSGPVRVGDFVGIYYGGGTWLGCPRNSCARRSCPGYPSGIFTPNVPLEKWFECPTEVFRIYAYGKGSGAIINSGDFIMLYFVNQQRWVSLGPYGNVHKKPCPGYYRPPSTSRYDNCSWEVFRIWKR